MADLIVPTAFSLSPHSTGAVLTVLTGKEVAVNLKLSTTMIWVLQHEIAELSRQQTALEMAARNGGVPKGK